MALTLAVLQGKSSDTVAAYHTLPLSIPPFLLHHFPFSPLSLPSPSMSKQAGRLSEYQTDLFILQEKASVVHRDL